jgi:hypothetical protein
MSRIGVLGPKPLEVASGHVAAAAIRNQTAHLHGATEAEKRGGDEAQSAADRVFRIVGQQVLDASPQPLRRSKPPVPTGTPEAIA